MADLASTAIKEFCNLLDQSMIKIEHCVRQLNDQQIWYRPGNSLNSIGNLILHLRGNLRQWAVCGIGNQTDDRKREQEFTQTEIIPAAALMGGLRETVGQAKEVFQTMNSGELLEPRNIQGFEISVYEAMSHTTTHFVGHTHQIIYLTRLQIGDQYKFQWSPENERSNLPI